MRAAAWTAALLITLALLARGERAEDAGLQHHPRGQRRHEVWGDGPAEAFGADDARRRLLYSTEEESSPIRIRFLVPERSAEGYDCTQPGDLVQVGAAVATGPEYLTATACSDITPPRRGIEVNSGCIHACGPLDVVGQPQLKQLHEALVGASAWFASAVSVRPVQGNLQPARLAECAELNHVSLPAAYVQGAGVPDADLLVTVAVRPLAAGVVSNSSVCSRDTWGRPLAAHLSLSPTLLSHSLEFQDTANMQRLLWRVLLHEMTHILGFDTTSLLLLRDERLQLRSQVIAWAPLQGQMEEVLQTPRVVAAAREHFSAPEAEGFFLEANSTVPSLTKDFHWHPEAAVNEIMSTTVSVASVYSRLTLAYLEDTGWYRANYSAAEVWDWGRGQGGAMLWHTCRSLPEGAYNCAERGAPRCSYDRRSIGHCASEPDWVAAADDLWALGKGPAPQCDVVLPTKPGACVATAGPDSRCFELSPATEGSAGSGNAGAGKSPACLPHTCLAGGLLSVLVELEWVECPKDGGAVVVDLIRSEAGDEDAPAGTAPSRILQCPPAAELCQQPPACPNGCSGWGECVNGVCSCWAGREGKDCSARVCPESCKGPGVAKCSKDGECVCNPGWAGVDCSSKAAEPCEMDCSELGPGTVCIDGRCERRCSSESPLSRCIEASAAAPYLQLCGRYLSGAMICGPENLEDITSLEAQRLGSRLKGLMPVQPQFSASTAVCHESALHLACALSFQVCNASNSDIVVPTCLSTCYAFHNDCNLYSSETNVWCSPGATFRDDSDDRGCLARQEVSWMHHSLQTLSIYGLFLLGSCLLLYSTYRLLRTWYIYNTYGGTSAGWFRWMFCSWLPTRPARAEAM